MTLGFTPSIELYGANAARFNERLISWTHIDAAGIESDQLSLTLDIEGLEGLPELGGKVGLRVGYLESGLVDRGEFVITRRTPNLFPPRLTLVATAAPSRWRIRPASSSAAPPAMAPRPSARCFAS